MPVNRRHFTASLLATAALPKTALSRGRDDFKALVFGTSSEFEAALAAITASGDPAYAAPLIQAIRFSRRPTARFDKALHAITGENHSDWFDWMLWQEQNPQITPHPDFALFKRDLFLQIDPNFDDFLKPAYLNPAKMRIRIEEITWGGVIKDGIPSLDNPKLIPASEAGYLRGDDLVFGVSINGDTRAYPLRIMGWHEMFNDVIGGVPVALAYCTLCGSGILFETDVKGRAKPLIFGSSGFLYRSNKLMFDRETHSLWNQYTGQPVMGPLVDSGIKLKQRPVTITTWENWQRDHPNTTVLSLDTGHRRNYGSGVVYQDYFASRDLMFPADVDEARAAQKDYVFAIREYGAAKAWPLDAFSRKPVINDHIGATPLVLIGDAKTRTVRAYERGTNSFKAKGTKLRDASGADWAVTEDALTSPSGKTLPRVAGHISYFFAWDNYLGPKGELYEG